MAYHSWPISDTPLEFPESRSSDFRPHESIISHRRSSSLSFWSYNYNCIHPNWDKFYLSLLSISTYLVGENGHDKLPRLERINHACNQIPIAGGCDIALEANVREIRLRSDVDRHVAPLRKIWNKRRWLVRKHCSLKTANRTKVQKKGVFV